MAAGRKRVSQQEIERRRAEGALVKSLVKRDGRLVGWVVDYLDLTRTEWNNRVRGMTYFRALERRELARLFGVTVEELERGELSPVKEGAA